LKLLVLCFELFVFMVPAFVFHGIIVASHSCAEGKCGAECESNWNIPQHRGTPYLQIIWHQLLASKYKFGWNND